MWKCGPSTIIRLAAVLLIVVICGYTFSRQRFTVSEETRGDVRDAVQPKVVLIEKPREENFVPIRAKHQGSDCPSSSCSDNFLHIYAESAAETTKICVNGSILSNGSRTEEGIALIVINTKAETADTPHFFHSGIEIAQFLKGVEKDRMVVVVGNGNLSETLNLQARFALEKLGSSMVHVLRGMDTWAFIGQVGSTTLSLYEIMKSPTGKDSTTEPAVLNECVPIQLDDTEDLGREHREFCSKRKDKYGEYCKLTWQRPTQLPEKPLLTNTFPIAIIAGDRAWYLWQVLASLYNAPGFLLSNLIVFQDGYNHETFDVVRQFGVRRIVYPRANSKTNKDNHKNVLENIAIHYKRSLDTLWEMYPDQEYIIILEDDLIVAPDFFDYFHQIVPVLRADSTLFSASSWNDNGYLHSSADPTMIYRTDFFPGLGWLLSKKWWLEIVRPSWPKCCWDWGVRLVLQQRRLDSLYPDVSRSFHIGKSGSNVNPKFFEHFFQDRRITTEPHYELADLDSLVSNEAYTLLLGDLISNATPVDHTRAPCDKNFIPPGDETLVLYYYQEKVGDPKQGVALVHCLKLWDLEKNLVRDSFRNVLRTHFNGNSLLIVGSESAFGKKFKPKDLKPFKLK